MKITIVGVGYVGLVTGACLAEKGHFVICLDNNKEKIEKLQKGVDGVIYEGGLEGLLEQNRNRLCFTTDFVLAYKEAEVIFICVGTPEKKDGSANLSYVFDVAQQIAETIEKDCIVVVKSTVPMETNTKLDYLFCTALKEKGLKIHVVSNPEFLSQGTAVKDTLQASRIVIGTDSDYARNIMSEVYKDFESPKVFVGRNSAEMIKYASNDFLALKISYINEIANLCEELGADIDEVSYGMGLDSRIGTQFLRAGIGYGGSCFPKDTKALHWLSTFHDHELKTVKAAIEVNEKQKLKLIRKARKYYDTFQGLRVAILGLTFKPGTDDLRDAPSVANLPILLDDGAVISVFDPVGSEKLKKIYPDEITYCENIDDTIKNADICFIFTEWAEIKNYNPGKFVELMKKPIVLDGRNCYMLEDVRKIPTLIYESIGRMQIDNK